MLRRGVDIPSEKGRDWEESRLRPEALAWGLGDSRVNLRQGQGGREV